MKPFTKKINDFKETFIQEYGELKFRKIHSKISNSKKIIKLIYASQDKQIAPTKNDFLYTVNGISFFMFAKADTIAMGAILALELWNDTVNTDFFFLEEYNLNQLFESILFDCENIKFN